MKKQLSIIIGLVVVVAVFAFISLPKKIKAPTDSITNYEQCVAAGHEATASYPGQCRTPDGRVFIQNVPPKNQLNPIPSDTINNFEQCAAAGNSIMESFPEQCMTSDGRSFTRELTEEEKQKVLPPSDKSTPNGICEDTCGDGVCQEIVCQGSGCPCAETKTNCSQDCGKKEPTNVGPGWQAY